MKNSHAHWNAYLFALIIAISYHHMPAAYLMVAGGKHPRGSTSNIVTPLGGSTPYSPAAYDAVAKAFYFANTECLTSGATFEMIRFCMVDVYKPDLPGDSANIANAWAAVGVVKAPTNMYTGPITNMALSAGSVRHYYMDVIAGQAVSCSTNGPNGDADLYLRLGSEAVPDPAFTGNTCFSTSEFSIESCTTFAALGPTRVYAAVHAYSAFSGLTFECTKSGSTSSPTSVRPTSARPTSSGTAKPTTRKPGTTVSSKPTTRKPTSKPTQIPTDEPTTEFPTTDFPTTYSPTTDSPTTDSPTTDSPTTESPTTDQPTSKPTTSKPSTRKPSTRKPTTRRPTTRKPTTRKPIL
jgi:hypothetical protein